MRRRKRNGFSLVEMVVVILVLGIIAAVAAPRLFDTAGDARANGTKQNLAVIRDAIELYKSQEDSYPAQATFAADLKAYIRGPFPSAEVGTNKGDAGVRASASDPIIAGDVGGTEGWLYNETSAEFVINDAAYLTW